MRLGEVFQLILGQAQHDVWKRRGRGESAATISDDLGIDVETVHAWFLEWGARSDAAFQRTRALLLTFNAASCEVDDRGLTWPEQPGEGPPEGPRVRLHGAKPSLEGLARAVVRPDHPSGEEAQAGHCADLANQLPRWGQSSPSGHPEDLLVVTEAGVV